MARQANGTYIQPANTAAVTATTIASSAYNTLITDIGTEITNSVDRGGRSAMTAALPMGSNKITGMAEPAASTDAATKNYVDTTTAAFFSTGDVKLTIKTAADSGWLLFADGATFGNNGSGSNTYVSPLAQPLFTLMFNNITDAWAPILTSGGGATTRAAQVSAAAAWAALCRMTLPLTLGRALAISGSGSGLTTRLLGSSVGAETHTLTLAELPTNIQSATANSSVTVFGNLASGAISAGGTTYQNGMVNSGGGGTSSGIYSIGIANSVSFNTSGGAHSIMPPAVFFNAMIKL